MCPVFPCFKCEDGTKANVCTLTGIHFHPVVPQKCEEVDFLDEILDVPVDSSLFEACYLVRREYLLNRQSGKGTRYE